MIPGLPDMAGPPRLDLLYAHIEDPAVPMAETVETFAALVAEGTVLARLIGAEVPVIPLIGASSVAQPDESLAAVDLELTSRAHS